MSSATDSQRHEHPPTGRLRNDKQPSRKQPKRAPSQFDGQRRGAGLDTDAIRFLDLSPPTSDTQFDPLTADTANLDINTSSAPRSDISLSTQLTSISRTPRSQAKSSNTTKDSDGKQTRSRSPVKKVVDLSAARPQIRYNPGNVSEDVELILKRFRNIVRGKRLMPLGLKDDIKALDPTQFYETEDEFDQGSPLSTVDKRILKAVTKIRGNALECSRESKPEPSWGSEVFRPLLDLAVDIENIDAEQKVQTEDITTVPVSPSFLPLGIYNNPLQAKRVDYGIYLSQTDDQRHLLRNHLEARNIAAEDLCVNQTPVYAEYIRWLPQLLAVETKTGEPNGVSAEAQLAIWMAGLRNRLESLLNVDQKSRDLPLRLKPMPCLKFQGFDCKMYWCAVSEKGETIMHGPQELGNTQTILGIYRILIGLRELIRYGRDEYTPWVMKECYLVS